MDNVVDWVFFYPDPDYARGVRLTTPYPYSGGIGQLWKLAKAEDPNLAEKIGKAELMFYVPPDLSVEPAATLLSRSRDWLREHRDGGQLADNFRLVSTFFPHVPHPNSVHVLVVTEELLEDLDYLGGLEGQALRQRQKSIKSLRNSIPTPSNGVSTSAGVKQVFVKAKDDFHGGRPAGNFGPPVSLFNPALGQFDYDLCHLDDESFTVETPPLIVYQTHLFMDHAMESYSGENERVKAIKGILSEVLRVELDWEVKLKLARFGIKPDAINFGDNPFVVVEVKNEAGIEGDAFLQAALSYAHIASSQALKYPAVRSNYPAVLCCIMGDLLEIGVATYTDGPYYNLLFSERLRLDFYAAKRILRLARAFAATRRVIADLGEFYQAALPAPGSIAHLFPSPLPVPTYNGSVPSLTFTRRLSRSGKIVILAEDEATRQSGIYLANVTTPRSTGEDTVMSSSVDAPADTSEVVVKFTAQYHPEAHRLLASKGLAPEMHACVPVCGGLFMVVMDRVHGEMAWQACNRRQLLPYDVYKDIQNAVALLHSNNLVFGDLRTPNIMVVPGGSGSDARVRGMLIDFDWVGVHRISRYPASLDDGLPDWESSGIQRYGIMDKDDDLAMLKKFKDRCLSA